MSLSAVAPAINYSPRHFVCFPPPVEPHNVLLARKKSPLQTTQRWRTKLRRTRKNARIYSRKGLSFGKKGERMVFWLEEKGPLESRIVVTRSSLPRRRRRRKEDWREEASGKGCQCKQLVRLKSFIVNYTMCYLLDAERDFSLPRLGELCG